MKMSDDGTLRPATPHRLVLRRQMMKVKDLGSVRPGGTERSLPHRRQAPDQVDGHRRQHHIGGAHTILERRMHRHRRSEHAPAGLEQTHRLGVIEAVHTNPGEERRRMRLIPRPAQRSAHQLHRPARANQRPRQVPRRLRRSTARKEQQPHHHVSSRHSPEPTADSQRPPRPHRAHPLRADLDWTLCSHRTSSRTSPPVLVPSPSASPPRPRRFRRSRPNLRRPRLSRSRGRAAITTPLDSSISSNRCHRIGWDCAVGREHGPASRRHVCAAPRRGRGGATRTQGEPMTTRAIS